MGVSQFFPQIRELFPSLIHKVSLKTLKDKKVAIELSSLMYRMAWNRPTSNDQSFMLSILDFHDALKLIGCKRVLFIFDADRDENIKVPEKFESQEEALQWRLYQGKKKTQMKRRIQGSGHKDAVQPLLEIQNEIYNSSRINALHFKNLRMLMDNFKIEYVVAPIGIEAEWLAVQYQLFHGEIDVVITTDSDAVACGSPCVFTTIPQVSECCHIAGLFVCKNLGHIPRVATHHIEVDCTMMCAQELYQVTQMNMQQIIHACVMSGTDHFTGGFKGVSFNTALSIIHEYKSIHLWIKNIFGKTVNELTAIEKNALATFDSNLIDTALLALAPNEHMFKWCLK